MKFQLSAIAVMMISSSVVYADINLGSDINHVSVIVNSDDGNIGDFIVYNGSVNQIETLRSNRHFTKISTSGGNSFSLDNNGASLSNIKLSGVADGAINANSTDAVNGSQLFAVQQTANAADTVLQSNIDQERLDRIEGDRQTLVAANSYTDQRFNKLERGYQAAVAASIAIASLPQPTEAGKSMVSFGTGAWESEQGYAVGVSGVTQNNKWVYKAAGTGDSRGKFGGGASIGLQW